MNTELIEYLKNRKGNRIGVVVARIGGYEKKTQVGIGWSLCHSKLDKYDEEKGLNIARGRAKTGTEDKIPQSMVRPYMKMMDRSNRYFRGVPICSWFVDMAVTANMAMIEKKNDVL